MHCDTMWQIAKSVSNTRYVSKGSYNLSLTQRKNFKS